MVSANQLNELINAGAVKFVVVVSYVFRVYQADLATDRERLFTAVHKDGIDDFHEHLNRQNADIQFTKEIDYLQKTDTYRPITRPVFVQPDLSQGYYYPGSDETSATSLRLA